MSTKENKPELFKENSIKIEPAWPEKPWRGSRIEVCLVGYRYSQEINVYPNTSDIGRDTAQEVVLDYGVNWSALGTTGITNSIFYGSAILMASAEATRLTALYKGRNVYFGGAW